MLAYKYKDDGIYEGEVNCQIDPLESEKAGYEIYLLPANATYTKPLDPKEGYGVKYDKEKDEWEYVEKKKDPEPEPYVPTQEDKENQVKGTRNYYLQQTDFTQLDDAPYTEEEKAAYREYRQYLRDFTDQEEWWEMTVPTFEEWEVAQHPVTEAE